MLLKRNFIGSLFEFCGGETGVFGGEAHTSLNPDADAITQCITMTTHLYGKVSGMSCISQRGGIALVRTLFMAGLM